jgi:hypothetical protein
MKTTGFRYYLLFCLFQLSIKSKSPDPQQRTLIDSSTTAAARWEKKCQRGCAAAAREAYPKNINQNNR